MIRPRLYLQFRSIHRLPQKKKYECFEDHCISRRQRYFAIIGGTCGVVSVVGLLSTIGPLVVLPSSEHQSSMLSLIVSWICALGLLISSVLNGFGSVSLPYTTLSGFFLHQVRPDHITKLEGELRNMKDILTKKQNQSKEMKVEITTLNSPKSANQSSAAGSPTNAFSFSSLLTQNSNATNSFTDLGIELKKRRQLLHTEIEFMEDLVREMTLDLEELKYSQITAAAARTSFGKTKLYVGIVFSIILLVRLVNAGFSILKDQGTILSTDYISHQHKKARTDIVTTTLLWLTGHKYFSYNQYNMLSQMVSLVLSAVLSFSQVRTFLRTATTVHRRLSRFYKNIFPAGDEGNGTVSSSNDYADQNQNYIFLWRIISALLGCYSLACIVLIKMLLPERFSVAFSMALSETCIFTIHSSVVNTVFFSSAVLSATILGMALGIQRQNVWRHASILTKKGSNVRNAPLADV
mmetsp:Transcript_18127/g.41458  ORF Transcript_18127/g.41458 Transcript_18127/m.41458 type:complete len:465 (-) Transcript_18127:656-2050(-)